MLILFDTNGEDWTIRLFLNTSLLHSFVQAGIRSVLSLEAFGREISDFATLLGLGWKIWIFEKSFLKLRAGRGTVWGIFVKCRKDMGFPILRKWPSKCFNSLPIALISYMFCMKLGLWYKQNLCFEFLIFWSPTKWMGPMKLVLSVQ